MAELLLDVFNTDAFHYVELSDDLIVQPFQPGYVTSLNLFQEEGVVTRMIAVEKKNEVLYILPFRTPGDVTSGDVARRATLYPVTVPHVPFNTSIYPNSLAGRREFGSATEMSNLPGERARHLRRHANHHALTEEYHKLAAVQGFVYDADGTEHLSAYTLFGVSKPATQAFNLAAATDDELRNSVDTLYQNMQDSLLGTPMQGEGLVLCGNTFFREFVTHTAVAAAYERWSDNVNLLLGNSGQPGDFLRSSPIYRAFPYRGLLWKHYQSPLNPPAETLETTLPTFIADTAAHAFPIDVPELFISRWAPSEFLFETVNTVGRSRYMFSEMERDTTGEHLDLHSEQNGIHLCTRPEVLHELTSTA